jgi:hypothetical protein
MIPRFVNFKNDRSIAIIHHFVFAALPYPDWIVVSRDAPYQGWWSRNDRKGAVRASGKKYICAWDDSSDSSGVRPGDSPQRRVDHCPF